jgi:uncharacterized protein YjbI with pentapeptide repeats
MNKSNFIKSEDNTIEKSASEQPSLNVNNLPVENFLNTKIKIIDFFNNGGIQKIYAVLKDLGIPAVIFIMGSWLNHQADLREQVSSQDLNHQRILENYINNVKEIDIRDDYSNNANPNNNYAKDKFIQGMTLPVLRELTLDEDRKAQLVLFLYKLYWGKQCDTNCTIQKKDSFFTTADLKSANFKGYQLSGISFQGADLRQSVFEAADLNEANLSYADISCFKRDQKKSWFQIPLMSEPKKNCANLKDAILTNTNLTNTNLSNANLTNANLTNADLTNANLINSTLDHVNFQSVKGLDKDKVNSKWYFVWQLVNNKLNNQEEIAQKLTEINNDLSNANLSGTNFKCADLTNVNLINSTLDHVNFQGIKGLNQDQVNSKWYFVWQLVNDKLNTQEIAQKLKEVDNDLSNANLSGVNFKNADLTDITLTNANLTDINLKDINLTEVNFKDANLTNANLSNTNLTNADLTNANLTNANLTNADLTNANLINTRLDYANFRGVIGLEQDKVAAKWYFIWQLMNGDLDTQEIEKGLKQIGNNLSNANLTGANFKGANLTGINLTGANFKGVDITNANLTNANLANVNLTNANLTNTNLTNANLTNANLTNVNLTNANLTENELRTGILCNTIMMDGEKSNRNCPVSGSQS